MKENRGDQLLKKGMRCLSFKTGELICPLYPGLLQGKPFEEFCIEIPAAETLVLHKL